MVLRLRLLSFATQLFCCITYCSFFPALLFLSELSPFLIAIRIPCVFTFYAIQLIRMILSSTLAMPKAVQNASHRLKVFHLNINCLIFRDFISVTTYHIKEIAKDIIKGTATSQPISYRSERNLPAPISSSI